MSVSGRDSEVTEYLEDDEEFCPTCFAGTESPEHFIKCGGDVP